MAPLRGGAPLGQRLCGKAPFGHGNTRTFIGALRSDRLGAPWRRNGPINGARFLRYVETVLVPTLRPGAIVVLDHLGRHKGQAVRRAIRAAGAKVVFLPKYSPDPNPIEPFFSKLKPWLHNQEKRSADAVCDAIGSILQTVIPQECANYFKHAGYTKPYFIPL
jgi:putative transposase